MLLDYGEDRRNSEVVWHKSDGFAFFKEKFSEFCAVVKNSKVEESVAAAIFYPHPIALFTYFFFLLD